MQTSSPAWKKWLVPLGIIGGLAVVMVLSSRDIPSPTGQSIIYNVDTYQTELQNAVAAATPYFIAFENGEDISESGKATLRKCAVLFDSLNQFLPDKAGPYLDAGRSYLAVGDYETAEARLQQCLNNAKLPKTEIRPDGVADAKRLLSMVRGQQGRWEEAYTLADEAVKAFPEVPGHYVQRAATEIQLNRVPEAKGDIAKALTLNPQDKRAQQLQQLLEQVDEAPAKP